MVGEWIARLRHRWRMRHSPSYRVQIAGQRFLDGFTAGMATAQSDHAAWEASGMTEAEIQAACLRRVLAFPAEHPETWAQIERSAALYDAPDDDAR